MRKYLPAPLIIFLYIILLMSLTVGESFAADDSGTFRGKWWNYYDRGVEGSEKGEWDGAVSDLNKTIAMRPRDQRMARTYGMHFIDYFPHRELGIIYFNRGEIDSAITELEESISSVETAKAAHFLNKARQLKLRLSTRRLDPPVIKVESLLPETQVKDFSIAVKGKTTGEAFVSKIFVNDSQLAFELARESVEFEREVQLNDGENIIRIRAEDLVGGISEKTLTVHVDREGPAIIITDIVNGGAAGGVRITGEVTDSTGIRRLTVDDTEFVLKDLKKYEFNIPLKRISGRSVIRAVDSLGNETVADMDIEAELAVFGRRPEPVLLAFNAPGILSFDKEAPVVRLREAGDPPQVFIDRYFIEGEAFDNRKVDKLLINGNEITSGRGRKVFFSKMVKLGEGQNRIKVEVLDGSGNRASTELMVKRTVPSINQVGSRMSISVLPFENKNRDGRFTESAYERLIGAFVDQKRFNVVERTKLEQVLIEQKLTRAKLTDPEHSIRVGRLMAADAVLATTVKENQKSIEIISRVINTETSEVMEVKDVFAEDKGLSSVAELMEGLALKVAAGFPVVEGLVVNRDRKEIFTDVGNRSKIRKNTGVVFFRKGKEIKHPVTGKSLGFDTIKLGEGRVEEVQEDFSKISLMDKAGSKEINVRDMVITK